MVDDQQRGCLKEVNPHQSESTGATTEGADGAGPCHSRASSCLGKMVEFRAAHQQLLEVLSSLKLLRIPQFA